MTRIALTGNIASGKSAVQKILQENGFKVLDCDDVAHSLLTVKNPQLYETFKDYDVFENNEFSRIKLGQLVFNNEKLRNKLEEIIHPQIVQEIEKFEGIVAIPLLFEAKLEHLFDKIIMVYADDEKRLARLMKRNNLTREEALKRMKSQLPQDEKLPRCNYVINNNGTLEELTIKMQNLNITP